MAFDVNLSITGIQEAQQKNLRAIAAMRPGGALERAILYATTEAHRYADSVTHVDTGALKGSQRVSVSGKRGMVYLDGGASNPRSGRATSEYGVYEHRRGGSHAFYDRTLAEDGERIKQAATGLLKAALYGG